MEAYVVGGGGVGVVLGAVSLLILLVVVVATLAQGIWYEKKWLWIISEMALGASAVYSFWRCAGPWPVEQCSYEVRRA